MMRGTETMVRLMRASSGSPLAWTYQAMGHHCMVKALFSSEKNSDFATVALLFLFDKYCSIMN